jgi:uncharacterized phage-associated protein
MNPVHVAQYIVNRFGGVPGGITPLKLQKLLYYVAAWDEAGGPGGIVDGPFERWPLGPVNGEHEPTGEVRAFAEFIGASYARFPAVTLSVMTHREDPWRLTADGAVIDPALMRAFYGEVHPFRVNLPFDRTAAYRPVQSDAGKSFTMDLSAEDEARATTFLTFETYLQEVDRLQKLGMERDGMLSRLLR